ncbi:hypothetical protein NYE33_35425 [Paenibacillus sp. FSL R10-2199]|uniref:hypothetical protein n=1 Tax=Paenibacillus sp. FSL R10-2199 TaxID=2975348 RepID=UPI0030F5C5F4
MKKHVPYMMAGSLLAAILLAGCSSDTAPAAATSGDIQTAQTQSGSEAAQPDGTAGAGQNRMDRAGMNIGKIKSISGNTITIYTADMPARQQNGGEGTAPEGGAAAPGNAAGAQAEGQGTPPEGGQPTDGGGKDSAQGGGRQGGGMMQNFSEETTDITTGSDTQYVSVTFDNGAQTETALSLSDLKADDIIQYTLKTDTAEAEKITLSTGGFGGGGMGGGGRGQGKAPAGDAAASGSATGK